jgi:hypothetical protein
MSLAQRNTLEGWIAPLAVPVDTGLRRRLQPRGATAAHK